MTPSFFSWATVTGMVPMLLWEVKATTPAGQSFRKKAIGLSHSGWRGTVGKIGKKTVEKMQEHFGSDPADILAAIGPSVCVDCYEVSADVAGRFREVFDREEWDKLFYEKPDGKYQLNLWKANEIILREAGILPEHTAVTNLCTRCNSRILYSHRAQGDRRGNLCAFLALKKDLRR